MTPATTRAKRSRAFTTPLTAVIAALSLAIPHPGVAQHAANAPLLHRLSRSFELRLRDQRPALYYRLLRSTAPAQQILNDDPNVELAFIDEAGHPRFFQTTNLNAAKTIRTWDTWPIGPSGHGLTGAGTLGNEFAIWDAGGVRTTHQEFGARVTQKDTVVTVNHFHATHVAGTLVAAGVDPNARGMSYEANLDAYDWNLDSSEMASAAASGLQVSNHSYGFVTGWYWSSSGGVWYWYGDLGVDASEDYGFGFYSDEVKEYDDIAYNAPNYLIVKSSGNDRDDAGPGSGGGHYHWDGGAWVWATDSHDPDGSPGGYDTIGWIGNAKNILTVGSVLDIPAGYSTPGDVVQSGFSSWGPTDDGRIKPDVVTNGDNLYSVGNTSDTAYLTLSGTSMATPNAAGSVNLLVGEFEAEYGKSPLSSTMKALVVNTADEAGPSDGPDYSNGWGLMNTVRAADVIAAKGAATMGIGESRLVDGEVDRFYFAVVTPADVRVTIAWTDSAGTPTTPSLDPTTPMLVDDLDLRVENLDDGVTYLPWHLDAATPSGAATRADNTLDNVEQVDIAAASAGSYRVVVSHKGTLAAGYQDYSIVWRGAVAAQPPDTVAGTTSPTGVWVDLEPPGAPTPKTEEDNNQERSIFITAVRDFSLAGIGMKLWIPCPSAMSVRLYAADGTIRGALLAESTETVYHPGEVFHYIAVDYPLESCQDYEIACTFGLVVSWPWWGEAGGSPPVITEPYDTGGLIRVRDGANAGSAGDTKLPHFAVFGTPLDGAHGADLSPPSPVWSVCGDSATTQGVYITSVQTVTVASIGWEAAFSDSQPVTLTGRVYQANGTTRGGLIAEGVTSFVNTDTLLTSRTIPLSAVLKEGNDYDVEVEAPAGTWSCMDESGVTRPYTVGPIRVIDAEVLGEADSTSIGHFAVTWTAGSGGFAIDLGKWGDNYPPPQVSSAPDTDRGVFVTSLVDQELYSLGWKANVPEGAVIGMRVYAANGKSRGALISSGEVLSSGDSTRWHDVPVAATLQAGADYDFEIDVTSVNAWRSWNDTVPPALPYTVNGAITIADAESEGDTTATELAYMRMGACGTVTTGIADAPDRTPRFSLGFPYPNPALGTSVIDFTLDEAGPVSIVVYDVKGRRVATLLESAHHPAGAGRVRFGTRRLPSGVYFVKMTARYQNVSRKVTIVH